MTEIPEVDINELSIWDDDYGICGGFIDKKASKSSAFSKGKWQKRWFFMITNLEDDENYSIEYSYSPDDKLSRQKFSLVNATIKISANNSFVINFFDDSMVMLKAESSEKMTRWIHTIEYIIKISNLRDKVINPVQMNSNYNVNSKLGLDGPTSEQRPKLIVANEETFQSPSQYTPKVSQHNKNVIFYHPPKSKCPALRLDVDIATIPPCSTARHVFFEILRSDMAKAIDISPDSIYLVNIKPAPGMDWLTLVEFDIDIPVRQESDGNRKVSQRMINESIDRRLQTLEDLSDMLQNPTSSLFNGIISCKIDPSFSANLYQDDDESDEFTPYSTDNDVLAIMERYREVQLPEGFVDASHFTIYLQFENKLLPISIPNPRVFKHRDCGLWPFEVKMALGFMGTMQELWVEPIALIPRGVPKHMSDPIKFEASVRKDDLCYINATFLRPDTTYEVELDDQREEALNSLTDEEMENIKETFQRYDMNSDGGISKDELHQLVKIRIQERKDVIIEKFNNFLVDPSATKEDIKNAENNVSQFLQHMSEVEYRLLKLYEAADTNGDGVISFTEFIMAESWWLRCTINPDKAHLF